MELSSFPCALCGAEQHEPLFVKDGFHYVRCGGCALVFVNPRYSDASVANAPFRVVRDEYAGKTDARVASRTAKYRKRLRRFDPYRQTGAFLEIGCREGHFLAEARAEGWQTSGVEPEAAPGKIAREEFGLDVHTGYLDSAGYEAGTFDVVYMNEVIEHVDQPVPLFEEIVRILRPGGVVYAKTGNVASLARKLYGAAWTYFAYREHGHVSFYSLPSFRFLCRRVGLAPPRFRTWGINVPPGWKRKVFKRLRFAVDPFLKLFSLGSYIEMRALKR